MSAWREAVRSEIQRYKEETGDDIVSLKELMDFSIGRLSSQFPGNTNPDAALRRTLQELRDHEEIEFLGDGQYRLSSIDTRQRSIWIEKTEIEGRQYKKEGELELGNAVYSPSVDKAGHRKWETMREADVGDIVLHLLQDKQLIVGVSTIESELDEEFKGLSEFGWSEEQQEAGGYRRWLTDYVEFENPIHIYDGILDNGLYYEDLHDIRESYSKIVYDKNLALNQGAYFTQCPPELAAIIVREGQEEVANELERRGYDVSTVTGSIDFDPAGTYDSIEDATEDISARIKSIPGEENWLTDTITTAIIEIWTDAFDGFDPGETVSPWTAARLDQIREVFRRSEARLQKQAHRIESGNLPSVDPAQTLFTALLRDLQDDIGTEVNARSDLIRNIIEETYCVAKSKEDTTLLPDSWEYHSLISHIQEAEPAVYKLTGPPDYWLTTVEYGSVSFEDKHENRWAELEAGDIALLHSRAGPSNDELDVKPNGLIGVGIVGETFEKDKPWWWDEHEAGDGRTYTMVASFERLFLTGDVQAIDTSRGITEKGPSEIDRELDALTANCLSTKVANDICSSTSGTEFPAQGMFARFRTESDEIDYDRPKALLEAMADDLTEVSSINPHKTYDGSLPEEILDGLYFPNDQGERILEQISTAIRSGKHILLTGPPGTGKTEIAERVCEHLATKSHPYLYSGFEMTTATADWSTFDTVGGYMPGESDDGGEELSFTPGIVLNRLKDIETGVQSNELIVIDELNRADIDKAFGQLFTLLSGQSVQLPYTVDRKEVELTTYEDVDGVPSANQYVVPNSWRIFATMNAYDKTSLYEMSYAFMRRFAFVRVPAPELPEGADGERTVEDVVFEYAGAWDLDISRSEAWAVGRVWQETNHAVEERAIGPAIVEDVLRYVTQHPEEELEYHLTQAVISYVFPQLEGVPKRKRIVREIANVREIDSALLEAAAREMLQVTLSENE